MRAPEEPVHRTIPLASLELLATAVGEIETAVAEPVPAKRYVRAHLVARRAAAAVLAARARPDRGHEPRSVWEVLPRVAPELGEWAAFFAAGTGKRIAVEAGFDQVVSMREADDLVRDAHNFLDLVVATLGRSLQLQSRQLALPDVG
jgi:SAV_6107-like HEPN